MFKLKYILIFLLIISCKSTKKTVNNKIDTTKEKVENISNTINVSGVNLSDIVLTFETADITKPVIIVDERGNKQQFQNIKKATLKKKTEQKKDSVVEEKKELKEKETDNSIINEDVEIVSDAKNVKGIFFYLALIVVCGFILFLIIRFRIKSKTDTYV